MRNDLPICVVGAGPCGSTAARLLCESGFRNVKLLEKRTWPRPKACAGGLGPRALAWLGRHGLLADIKPAATKISSLYFTAPSGRSARLKSPGEMALVMPRERFDDLLVQKAVRAGVDFRQSTHVTSITRGKNGALVSTSAGPMEAAAVILGTGALSGIRGAGQPVGQVLDSIMARYADFPHNPSEMEMIFPTVISPFYAWLFPEPEGIVNVGLVAHRTARTASLHETFDAVLERYFGPRIANARLAGRRTGAPVRHCSRVGRVVDGCILRAGESAGLVNGATAEGIPYALESGELAAAAIIRAVHGLCLDHSSLGIYQRMVRRRFAIPLGLAAAIRCFIGSPLFLGAADLGTLRVFQRLSAFMLAKV
jgi:geranylgeranyl reductase family protein